MPQSPCCNTGTDRWRSARTPRPRHAPNARSRPSATPSRDSGDSSTVLKNGEQRDQLEGSATDHADGTDVNRTPSQHGLPPPAFGLTHHAAASRLADVFVWPAGRPAGPDEGAGDQDHEPSCMRPRFVIPISRPLVPRLARRHEHLAPDARLPLCARVLPWRPCRPWPPWFGYPTTRNSAAAAGTSPNECPTCHQVTNSPI